MVGKTVFHGLQHKKVKKEINFLSNGTCQFNVQEYNSRKPTGQYIVRTVCISKADSEFESSECTNVHPEEYIICPEFEHYRTFVQNFH